MVECIVCRNIDGGTCSKFETNRDSDGFDCDICGWYEVVGSAVHKLNEKEVSHFTQLQRAALSHRLRTAVREGKQPIITTDWLEKFRAQSELPSPAMQAVNIIRFFGDEVSRTGEPVDSIPIALSAIVGSPNREFAMRLAKELCDRGVLKALDASSTAGIDLIDIDLTLDGWEQYESENRGHVAG